MEQPQSFGDDIKSLKTDEASQPGNVEVMQMLFNKVMSGSDNKPASETKSIEKFGETKTFKNVGGDIKKAIILTVLFYFMRTSMFRNILAKATTNPLVAEVLATIAFIIITFIMLRYM